VFEEDVCDTEGSPLLWLWWGQGEEMKFSEYQDVSTRTMPKGLSRGDLLSNLCLVLAGESGEFVDLMKKHLYHGHHLDVEAVKSEMGDILWYLSSLAVALGVDLGDVAEINVDKLKSRYPNGFDSERSRTRVED
jgi:NTP pyrophosphatase (non-canonical NTP hydrolase)